MYVTNWTPEAIKQQVGSFPYWHYAFDLGHGIVTQPTHGDPCRQAQRLNHIFPPLLHLAGGSLAGLTVLDLGCNQGFWSLEAARAGAVEVLGVDDRPEHVAAARFIASATDIDNVSFQALNVFDPALLTHGQFDVVLCLGLLYHVDRPLELLERLHKLTRRWLVVDTSVVNVSAPILHLIYEDTGDPRNATREDGVGMQPQARASAAGCTLVAVPSSQAVERMLWHAGFPLVWRVPQRTADMPAAYRAGRRATWIAAGEGAAPGSSAAFEKPPVSLEIGETLLQAVPDQAESDLAPELLNPLAAESLGHFVREKLRQLSYRHLTYTKHKQG